MPALTATEARRLEVLAKAAGRSPRAMLRFVLRDGFDYCEWQVREGAASEADAKARGWVPGDEAQRRIDQVLALANADESRHAA